MINKDINFYRAINPIWDSDKIDASSKILLITLIQYWITYDKCEVSLSNLSKKPNISKRQTINKLKELEELQLISIVKSKVDKVNNVNQYIINEQTVNSFFQDKIFIINNKNNIDKFKKDEKK